MPKAPAGLIGRKRLFASFLVFSKMKASGRECPVCCATAHRPQGPNLPQLTTRIDPAFDTTIQWVPETTVCRCTAVGSETIFLKAPVRRDRFPQPVGRYIAPDSWPCLRQSHNNPWRSAVRFPHHSASACQMYRQQYRPTNGICLLYTSDAADE